jgi:Holliday junction resolvasome RuvABC endonuclease subunit
MSKGKSVFAIDGASFCGVVVGVPGRDPEITTWRLAYNKGALGETLLDLRLRLLKAISDSREFGSEAIGTVIFEKPLLNQKTPNLNVGRKLYGITGIVEMVAYECNIDCYEIPAGTWKKVFVGRGNVSKKEVPYPPMVRCDKLGWKVNSHDEADACGIWYTWAASFDDPTASGMFSGPLFEDA